MRHSIAGASAIVREAPPTNDAGLLPAALGYSVLQTGLVPFGATSIKVGGALAIHANLILITLTPILGACLAEGVAWPPSIAIGVTACVLLCSVSLPLPGVGAVGGSDNSGES
jgi:hypothetical protein